MATLIAWTDATLNFWAGCQKISDGCRNCYAEDLTKNRLGWRVWGPQSRRQPISAWRKKLEELKSLPHGILGPGRPKLAFVGSLMDWAEDHPDADRWRPVIWDTIRGNPEVHFQLLTKRADRIEGLLPSLNASRSVRSDCSADRMSARAESSHSASSASRLSATT